MRKALRSMMCLASFLLLMALGCAANRPFSTGTEAAQRGDWDTAVKLYEEAYASDPSNKDYKIELRRAKFEAAKDHLKKGNRWLSEKEFDKAMEEFQKALVYEPTFETSRNALELCRTLKEAERSYESGLSLLKAGKDSEARDSFRRAMELNPMHAEAAEQIRALAKTSRKPVIGQHEINLKSTKPISLKLADTSIKEAFAILSKLSGVNFLFDEEIKEKRVGLTLEDVKFEQALDLLTTVANLSRKVLSENTIMIYPNTPAKHSQYQDQFIQTFYLSNVDAKKAINLVRSVIQVKKIFVNEDLNAIVVRDDPDVIRVVEKILDANDITDSELMMDVEILEVDRNKLLDLGIELAPTNITARIVDTGGGTSGSSGTTSGSQISLERLKHIDAANVLFSLPSIVANLKKETSGVETLANPKIRVRNRGKARIHIGERIPIITTSTNLGVVTENIQYQDVGVKLDVEPWIHHNNEVTIKMKLEVSTLGAQVSGTQSVAFRIGTRVTESELRLYDRETQVVGGLIQDEERTTITRIPGIGDIPGIGYFFSNRDKSKVKTDILMSITPYILRNTAIPSKEVTSVWSGKENVISSQRPSWSGGTPGAELSENPKEDLRAGEPSSAPAAPPPPAPQSPSEEHSSRLFPDTVLLQVKGPREVQTGQEFEVEVMVDGAKALFSVPLMVAFDPERLRFAGIFEGDFLRKDGKLTSFMNALDDKAGKVVVGLSRLGDVGGVDGGGRLFSMRFQAVTSGTCGIRLQDVQVRDAAKRSIPAKVEDLSLEIR